jgi:hypothetical protein
MVSAVNSGWFAASLALGDPVSMDSLRKATRSESQIRTNGQSGSPVQVPMCDQNHNAGKGKMVRPRLSSERVYWKATRRSFERLFVAKPGIDGGLRATYK